VKKVRFKKNTGFGAKPEEGHLFESHGFKLVVHKGLNDWVVSEFSTGQKWSGGLTRKEAIARAEYPIKRFGIESIKTTLKEAIEKHGIVNGEAVKW